MNYLLGIAGNTPGLGVLGNKASGFNPLDLNPLLWLDASKLIQADNSPVSIWADQSGNGRNAVMADPSKQPSFLQSGINGKPAIYFNQAGDISHKQSLTIPTAGNPDPLQLASDFVIFTVIRTLAVQGYIITQNSPAPNYYGWGFAIDGYNGNPGALEIYGDLSNWQPDSILVNDNIGHIAAIQRTGNNGTFYVDGVAGATVALNLTGLNYNVQLAQSGNPFYEGYIAEVLVYPGLTSAARQKVLGYLTAKYAYSFPLSLPNPTADNQLIPSPFICAETSVTKAGLKAWANHLGIYLPLNYSKVNGKTIFNVSGNIYLESRGGNPHPQTRVGLNGNYVYTADYISADNWQPFSISTDFSSLISAIQANNGVFEVGIQTDGNSWVRDIVYSFS
jgi:hypothetical protein